MKTAALNPVYNINVEGVRCDGSGVQVQGLYHGDVDTEAGGGMGAAMQKPRPRPGRQGTLSTLQHT